MMATVPHVTSGLELRKFQADGFLLTRVYKSTFFHHTLLQTATFDSISSYKDHLEIFYTN